MEDIKVTKLSYLRIKLSSLHKSLTNWFNVSGVVILQTLVSYPELNTYLSTNGLLYIVIIGNVIIRVFKTSKAIEDK